MLCPGPNWPSPYDSPSGQKWSYTGTQFQQRGSSELPHYSEADADFCLDNADGKVTDGNKVQIWDCHDQCHPDYNNQVSFVT